jgi:hypothetical protein
MRSASPFEVGATVGDGSARMVQRYAHLTEQHQFALVRKSDRAGSAGIKLGELPILISSTLLMRNYET